MTKLQTASLRSKGKVYEGLKSLGGRTAQENGVRSKDSEKLSKENTSQARDFSANPTFQRHETTFNGYFIQEVGFWCQAVSTLNLVKVEDMTPLLSDTASL